MPNDFSGFNFENGVEEIQALIKTASNRNSFEIFEEAKMLIKRLKQNLPKTKHHLLIYQKLTKELEFKKCVFENQENLNSDLVENKSSNNGQEILTLQTTEPVLNFQQINFQEKMVYETERIKKIHE